MTARGETYDAIGAGYASRRRADPRIAHLIEQALDGAETIVNVGAGAGSYEPAGHHVIAVEPSLTMIRQRPGTAAPVVRGHAEALPFGHGAFDAAMAVLTIHHWRDWRTGLREMARVAKERIVLFTWDPASEGFWLRDYLPRLFEWDRAKFPPLAAVADLLGGAQSIAVPIPHDCSDGFLGAHWRRPEAYLDPAVRAAMSSLTRRDGDAGLARLAADLQSGEWRRRHVGLLAREELDVGYRLVICR